MNTKINLGEKTDEALRRIAKQTKDLLLARLAALELAFRAEGLQLGEDR